MICLPSLLWGLDLRFKVSSGLLVLQTCLWFVVPVCSESVSGVPSGHLVLLKQCGHDLVAQFTLGS